MKDQDLILDESQSQLRENPPHFQPEPRYKFGVLAKDAKLVSSASEGAMTNKDL